MERRIIIAGTRTFSDYDLLRKVMSQTFGSLSMQEIQEMKGEKNYEESWSKSNKLYGSGYKQA